MKIDRRVDEARKEVQRLTRVRDMLWYLEDNCGLREADVLVRVVEVWEADEVWPSDLNGEKFEDWVELVKFGSKDIVVFAEGVTVFE